MPDLSVRMRAYAARPDTPSAVAANLREKADAFDTAVDSGTPRSWLGAWARARRAWCDATGEPLVPKAAVAAGARLLTSLKGAPRT